MPTPKINLEALDYDDAKTLLALVEGDIRATHNHIASAVESPELWTGKYTAADLVKQLRAKQELFKKINGAILRADGTIS